MAKQIDESKIVKGFKGPVHVIDEGKDGGYYGVWYRHPSNLWSHICSGLSPENAAAIANALNERTLFGNLNKHTKALRLQ